MKKRKICVITGTRADYGLLYPILKEIERRPALELVLIAVGMHFSREHGYSVREIVKDGFQIDYKIKPAGSRGPGRMALDAGKYSLEYARIFLREKPDLLFLFGDRGEMLAAALAAVYLNIPVVHYHGGDVSGNVDDSVRHAITKLSHYHFTSNPASAARVARLGEAADRIFVVGHTAWDNIKANLLPPRAIADKYGLRLDEPLVMVLQHSVVTEERSALSQMTATLDAVVKLRLPTIVIFPNTDRGGEKIISAIRRYSRYPFIKTFKNLPPFDYLSLLNIASVLVGNSSSGIAEAGFFGLPVVNIGSRQQGRYHGGNVQDVPHDSRRILAAVRKALGARSKSRHPYFTAGSPTRRIVDLLQKLVLDERLLQKQITY